MPPHTTEVTGAEAPVPVGGERTGREVDPQAPNSQKIKENSAKVSCRKVMPLRLS